MIRVVPAILRTELSQVETDLQALSQLEPRPELVQIDILDGEYAPELSIEPNVLQNTMLPDFQLDLHFMTLEPIDYVSELLGLEQVRTIIGQVERMSSQSEFIEEVQQSHFFPGFSLNLFTPFEAIDPGLLNLTQVVQVMGGQAGTQGQTFHESALAVIREAVEYKRELGLEYEIVVDIGMNPQTIPAVLEAGADRVVVGSYLQQPDRQKAWEELLEVS